MRIRELLALLVMVTTGVLFTTLPAFANGPPIRNETDHPFNATDVVRDNDPCTNRYTEKTRTYSGVVHITEFADGTVHATLTQHGTFTFDWLDANENPDGVDATGQFTQHFGVHGSLDPAGRFEFTNTVNERGTNVADGSSFNIHTNAHFILEAGTLKQEFLNSHCNQ